MIKTIRHIALHFLLFIVVLLTQCTMIAPNENSSTGGTGSEVVGVVNYPDSSEAAKCRDGFTIQQIPLVNGNVFINPINHLSDTGNATEESITITNSDGFFRIDTVVPGEHIIYIRDDRGSAVAHRFTVPEDQEPVDLGVLYAKRTAGVSVEYTGSTPGNVLFYLDVEGTDLQVKCSDGKLKVTLDRIPIGTSYNIIVRMYRPVVKSYRFPSIELSPGVTRVLDAITGE